ncbi:hypothetical protein LTR50_003730 [Elasticomyces elasticus]|nr:hypothetical protein LTR50_003730 [Elasticomyces elasticus]
MSSTRNSLTKRILKEATELAANPSSDYHAAPLEADLFEWHFTLCGPPEPSPFAGGIYHGRIILPPQYPLRPPSFRFSTPTGRFEVNREICLSISGHHEETWQPAWGIRTALVAIRSFMDTDAKGQLGGIDSNESVRRRLAAESVRWRCPGSCGGKTNAEIMQERDEAVKEQGLEKDKQKDVVPEELRLAYREDLGGNPNTLTVDGPSANAASSASQIISDSGTQDVAVSHSAPESMQPGTTTSQTTPVDQSRVVTPTRTQPPNRVDPAVSPWLDRAIIGVLVALVALVLKRIV